MSTRRTHLRRISRINGNDRDSRDGSLVFHESSQLKKAPTAHLCPLLFPEPSPSADACQFFDGYRASGVCSFRNQRFADDVVLIFPKPLLFLSDRFQFPTNIPGTFAARLSLCSGLLKFLSLSGVSFSDLFNAVAAEALTVAVSGQTDYAKINTQKVSGGSRCAVRQVNCYEQEPFAVFATNKVTLTVFQVEAFVLILAHHERHNDAAFQCQQRNPIKAFEIHQPLIVGDAGRLFESRPDGAIPAEGFADLRDTSDGHLWRPVDQAVPRPPKILV